MSKAEGTTGTQTAGSGGGNNMGSGGNLNASSKGTDATTLTDTWRPLRLRNPYPSSVTDIYLFEGSHPEIGVV